MKKLILTLFVFALFLRCGDDESVRPNNTDCGQKAIVDNAQYINAPDDEFSFVEVEINGDCMKISIRYGGGCRDIELKLIGSESVLFPAPGAGNIRLSLKDEDDCKALILKEITFDLTPFRLLNLNRVSLRLSGWDGLLVYEY